MAKSFPYKGFMNRHHEIILRNKIANQSAISFTFKKTKIKQLGWIFLINLSDDALDAQFKCCKHFVIDDSRQKLQQKLLENRF